MNKPLVSVIIPTYKRPDTLDRAIESVFRQTYTPIEIIVVDDNNPDSEGRALTEECMKKYENDSRVQYVKHEHNKNGSAARNTGARHSKGEYLAFLDDDDEYYPEKIAAQVKRLEELDETWGACYTKYIRKKDDGTLVSTSTEHRQGDIYFHELCRNFWHGGGTGPLVRRSVFEDIGGFDETFKRNQDVEYMIRIAKKYKVAYEKTLGHIQYVDSFHEIQSTKPQTLTNFLACFQKEIDALNPHMRKKFDKMIALQMFKYFLYNEHNMKEATEYLKGAKISPFLTIRYMAYLAYRKIWKVSCGFNI